MFQGSDIRPLRSWILIEGKCMSPRLSQESVVLQILGLLIKHSSNDETRSLIGISCCIWRWMNEHCKPFGSSHALSLDANLQSGNLRPDTSLSVMILVVLKIYREAVRTIFD